MAPERHKKNIVQDVLPSKRSIRNISIPSREHISIKKPQEEIIRKVHLTKPVEKREEPTPPPSYKYEYTEPKKSSRKFLYISLSLLVLVVAFGISAFFKSAEIKITPKTSKQTFNKTFTAKKDSTGSDLGFQVVTVSKELDKTVEATGDQKISKKANGRIVVYNIGSKVQKLIYGARFQTPEGLLFRSTSVVTLPAKTIKNGKTVAGSVELGVEANNAGSQYNIGLKDFKLPGLKGTPEYNEIYARSKTPMTGGYVGTQKIVSVEVLTSSNEQMEKTLKDSLSKDISSQIPADFVLYTGGLSYSFNPAVQITSASSTAVLRKKATATAVIFDKGALARAIVSQVIPDAVNDVVKITNLESFQFSYPNTPSLDLNSNSSINFNLSGEAQFVWVFDENKLKSDLLGLSRDKAKAIIATYPAIQEAWVVIKPFWNRTIPDDLKKVTLMNTFNQLTK